MSEEVIRPISKGEARKLVNRVKEAASATWELLAEIHERQAWVPLGYNTFRQLLAEEFDMSEANGYRLLRQEQVISAIEAISGDPRARESVSARQAAELHDRPEVIETIAHEIKSGVEAKSAVAKAVEKIRGKKADKPKAPPPPPKAEQLSLDFQHHVGEVIASSDGATTFVPLRTWKALRARADRAISLYESKSSGASHPGAPPQEHVHTFKAEKGSASGITVKRCACGLVSIK